MTNLRKAKSLYVSRHQEYDKVKEQALKAESDSQGPAAATNAAAKAEKKKKQEDDALQKVRPDRQLSIQSVYLSLERGFKVSRRTNPRE